MDNATAHRVGEAASATSQRTAQVPQEVPPYTSYPRVHPHAGGGGRMMVQFASLGDRGAPSYRPARPLPARRPIVLSQIAAPYRFTSLG